MPIGDKIFHPKMPLPYRQFLSNLWDAWQRSRGSRRIDVWSPASPTDCSMLELFAQSERIGKIAAKAYMTTAGRQIMEGVTKAAARLPDDLKFRTSIRETDQIRYLERVLRAVQVLHDVLGEDKSSNPARLAFSVAKADIAGDLFRIGRCISIQGADPDLGADPDQNADPDQGTDSESPGWLWGSVSLYGLTRILESLVDPIESKIADISVAKKEVIRGFRNEKQIVFALDDFLQHFSSDFKEAGKLEHRPVISAFFSVLSGRCDEYCALHIRTSQLLIGRKKLRTQRPVPRPRR